MGWKKAINQETIHYSIANTNEKKKGLEKRRKLLKVKERQATLLLGLILTAFIASWLPFFVGFLFK